MDVAAWCAESRVWVVAGKGGVGKTTVAATMAATAARAGLRVLLVDLEGKRGLSAAFGAAEPLGYEERVLRPGAAGEGEVRGRRITPDDALLEYLADHGLARVSRRLVSSGVLDVVATAIPGVRDVLVLGKVKQLERSGTVDLVVLDAPATGHAMSFLTSAGGLLDAARSGPVRTQAQDVVDLLRDPARCRVLLVTIPEEMPVSETVEAAYQLEDRVGVKLGPVVVNCYEQAGSGLDVDAAAAAAQAGAELDSRTLGAREDARAFRRRRLELVDEQVGRLAQELPLPQLRLPRLVHESIGPAELDVLAAALGQAVTALPEAVRAP